MQIELGRPPAAESTLAGVQYQTARESQPSPTPAKRQYHRRIDRAAYIERQRLRRQAEAKRRPMSEHRAAMIRRKAKIKAVLTELAALDRRCTDVAMLMGVCPSTVTKWCQAFGIELTRYAETPLQLAVRRGFGKKTYAEIASEMNTSAKVVGVVACRLGLTAGARHDPAKFSRGFAIPDEKWPEYIALRRELSKLTAVETAQVIGLLPRQPIQGPTP